MDLHARSFPFWWAVFRLVAVGGGCFELTAHAADHPALEARARREIDLLEREKALRTPGQRRIDSQLLHFALQHRGVTAVPGVPRLRREMPVTADGRVLVDLRASGEAPLLRWIERGGGRIISVVRRSRAIRALIPVDLVEALAEQPGVAQVRPADQASTQAGSVTSEGDVTHAADQARAAFGTEGAGVKVAVLSDSVDYLALSQEAGELPSVHVLPGQAGVGRGEGTAMLEIVHDLAPAAELHFATALGGVAGYAQNIRDLYAAGCRVFVDDVIYFSESPFQASPVAQAIADVTAGGALYFWSAGNSGRKNAGTSGTWEGDFADGGPATLTPGGRLHDFGGVPFNTVVPGGGSRRADLYWADPLGAATNDYDLFVLDADGAVVRSSNNVQDGDDDPYESLDRIDIGERIVVVKYAGDDRYLHLGTGRGVLALSTGGSIRGHAPAAMDNLLTVTATWVRSPAVAFVGGSVNPVETFGSDGPRRIFFRPDGTAVTPGNFSATGGTVLAVPNITAADGVMTAVPGFSGFFGTSAASPHAAALAALVWAYNPALTAEEVRAALVDTALDIETTGADFDSGAGIVMATAALEAVRPPRPRLVLAATSLRDGNANGTVDPKECVDLIIQIRNSISFQGGTATGVVGRLVSSTTGIVVDPGPREFPDVPAAEVVSNAIAFRFSAGSAFICSLPASFELLLTTANAGSFRLPFDLPSIDAGPGPARAFESTNVPVSIPDLATVESSLAVSDMEAPLSRVKVSVYLTHTYDADLTLTLLGPDGTAVELSSNNGGSGGNYGGGCGTRTVFDDSGSNSIVLGSAPFIGAFQPENPLSVFRGKRGAGVNGTWTLRVADRAELDVGTLQCWSLELSPVACFDGGGACLVPPLITAQPTNQVATNGQSVTWTVVATGSAPLRYQWLFNETPISSDATNAILLLPSVTAAKAGDYSVVVSNEFGIALSATASLTVVAPPEILEEPQDLTVTNGQSAVFSVLAAGSAPLAVQWRFADVPLPGATAPFLVLSNVSEAQAGLYSVVITNLFGSVASREAMLHVVASNAVPLVTLLSPSTGATFPADRGPIRITADARDDDGIVTSVEFVADGALLAVAGSVPYQFDWLDAMPGSHQLWAVAVDNVGGRGTSGVVVVTVEVSGAGFVTLIPTGAVWKYLDTGVDQGSAWRAALFADDAWPSGPAELGYGDDADGRPEATVISFGPSSTNKIPTYYFRHRFVLTDPGAFTNLQLRFLRDDGGVIYLNDVEVFRSNMPTGAITFATFAATTIPTRDETNYFSGTASPALLRAGTNVLAVEVHQANRTSSDVSFDAALTGGRSLAPRILHPPADLVVTNGQTAGFSVVAAGASPLRYQWRFNQTTNLSGATNPILTLTGVGPAQAGRYSVTVSNAFGQVSSAAATLSVLGTNGAPLPTNLLLVATGSVWRYLDTGVDPGPNWRNLDFDDAVWPAGPAELGYGDGAEGRPEATMLGFGPDPQAKFISYYFRHSFFMTNAAAMGRLRFQLLRDDGAVGYVNGREVFRSNMPPGPVGPSTRASATVAGPEEAAYFPSETNAVALLEGTNVVAVEIHQVNGTSSDISFDLEIIGVPLEPPVILTQPADLAVTNGNTAVFMVTVADDNALGYQWYFNATNPIPAALQATLVLSNATIVQAGLYRVSVSNAAGTLLSRDARLTVVVPPSNAPPSVSLIAPLAGAEFLSTAPITLLAEAVDPDGQVAGVQFLADGVLIGEVENAPFAFDWIGAPLGSHELRAVARDEAGARATSGPVTIRVVLPPPPPSLTVTVVPTNAVWKYLDNGIDQGTAWRAPDFDDHTWSEGGAELGYGDAPEGRPEVTVIGFGPDPNRKYPTYYFRHRFVIDQADAFISLELGLMRDDGAVVYLNGVEVFRSNLPAGPIGFTNLALVAVVKDEEATFFKTKVDPALLMSGTNVFAVEVHQVNPTSSDISFALGLTGEQLQAPVLLSQPQPVAVAIGGSAHFSVVALGQTPLHYQWFVNGLNVLIDETNATLQIAPVRSEDAGSYSVEVSNTLGRVLSDPAVLTVLEPPVIVTQPQDVLALLGSTVQFTVGIAGAPPPVLQWLFNQTNRLSGGTNRVLRLVNVQPADAGAYQVLVTNALGSVTSVVAQLVLGTVPTATVNPPSQTVVAGATATLDSVVTGTAPIVYQWLFNGETPITDATNAILQLEQVGPADAGGYRLRVTNAFGTALSGLAQLRVLVQPTINSLTLTNGRAVVSLLSVADLRYTLETNSTPTAPGWNLVPGATKIIGAGAGLSLTNSGLGNRVLFFRVLVE